ncbi:heme oxygenase-like protein, partial [Saccharata proteae CBS 121410]
HANPDIRRAFQEYTDESTPSKCSKVRCLHCGFTRAKNTTRQIEHLQTCQPYLNSPDAQVHLQQPVNAAIDLTMTQDTNNANNANNANANPNPNPNRAILNGTRPNPNLQVHRRGPNQNKRSREGQPIAPHPGSQPPPPRPVHPSLTAHLLTRGNAAFTAATQQPFLSHAGCGTLSASALSQWLVQDAHYCRGYIRFIGQMLAKIRLPVGHNSNFHPMTRVMDLLISALNNIRREMTFFEITATKFGLHLTDEPPNFITRAYLDLFISCTSSGASMLEGMVVLWATEHCYRSAWTYANSFSQSLSTPSSESHIVALHQSLIPNWTSAPFSKFVDACRTLVDELANTTEGRNGKEEMQRCEQLFDQVCWLEERFWPDVDGMGEEDESSQARLAPGHAHSHSHSHSHSASMGMGGGMPNGMNGPMNNGMNNGMGNGMNSGMNNNMSNSIGSNSGNSMMSGMETPTTDRNSFGGPLNGIQEAASSNT